LTFRIFYHPEVKADVSRIDKKLKSRIKKAIETRLMTSPQQYGEPLRKTLKGFWKLRVGEYRVVYSINKCKVEVYVVMVGFRRDGEVYKDAAKRHP